MHHIGRHYIVAFLTLVFLTGTYAADNNMEGGTSIESIGVVSNAVEWNFETGLDGWGRFINSDYKSIDKMVEWYDRWGGTQGVIVIDACEWPEENIHAIGGIRRTITLPDVDSITLNAKLVKDWGHDGGVRFVITKIDGSHAFSWVLGEHILHDNEHITVSYDISDWAGKEVTISIETFGAGTDMSGCSTPTCCYEYIGIDSIRLDYSLSKNFITWSLPIPKEALTSITWQFGRDDGSVISNDMHLNPDGSISGYYHPNEHKWEVIGNQLLFYHEDGRVSTCFNTFEIKNGKWVIQGPFLLPAEPYGYQTGHINHVLKQL